MKRRRFLKYSSALSLAPLALNNSLAKPFATLEMLPLMNCMDVDDRVLVIVFLKGGNDGGNTIIPVNQYDTYASNRPNIRLPNSGTGAFVPLDGTLALENQIGINPALASFKAMYDVGEASVIQAVGYPNSNGSHFKSTDLWLTGGDGTEANFNLGSGWMGRYLDTVYAGIAGNPTEANPDPIGIQLGDRKPSIGYYNEHSHFVAANLTQQDPSGLYELVQSIGTPSHFELPTSDYGSELSYIMSVENSTNVYAERITNVFDNGSNSTTTYPDSDLARQLKTIAKLISGGSKTKIYLVHTGGFDTHAGQVINGATHTGKHAELLSNVFGSLKAFNDDLTNLGHAERVASTTFSEFGRRMTQNGSFGTDHGNFAPMFLFGKGIQPGVLGTNPDISSLTSSGNLTSDQLQHDYRSIFKTLMQDWLGASDAVISSVYNDSYTKINNLVKTNYSADPSCYSDTLIRQTLVKSKVFLESFFNPAFQQMENKLASKNLIPLSQPFTSAPISYSGDESVTSLPNDVVDWILVELRDAQDVNSVLGRRAGFLRKDGQVIGLNGGLGVTFSDVLPGSYYLALYHKSHIAVVSSAPFDFSNLQNFYDFTLDSASAQGTDSLKSINGSFVMYAGDYNHSGTADNSDFSSWQDKSSKVNQYVAEDADGNGIVNNLDFNLWKRNKNKMGSTIIQK